jgi:hypothetical protein
LDQPVKTGFCDLADGTTLIVHAAVITGIPQGKDELPSADSPATRLFACVPRCYGATKLLRGCAFPKSYARVYLFTYNKLYSVANRFLCTTPERFSWIRKPTVIHWYRAWWFYGVAVLAAAALSWAGKTALGTPLRLGAGGAQLHSAGDPQGFRYHAAPRSLFAPHPGRHPVRREAL